jgi:uncharacterized protein (TIGR02996 family)
MPEEDSLLQAIFASPRDVGIRLAYAEWLAERGDPRAEYIRLCVQIQCDSILTSDSALLQRLTGLDKHYRWTLHVGIPMPWEEVWLRTLAETIAWCQDRANPANPGTCLRNPHFHPGQLQYGEGDWDRRERLRHRPSPCEDAHWFIGFIKDGRAEQLACQRKYPAFPPTSLHGGRLLLFNREDTLSDGAAEAESRGFFDMNNCPPCDTWVWFEPQTDWLLCWVPSNLVDCASAGILVNPEQCILWADMVDNSFTRRVRSALQSLPDLPAWDHPYISDRTGVDASQYSRFFDTDKFPHAGRPDQSLP